MYIENTVRQHNGLHLFQFCLFVIVFGKTHFHFGERVAVSSVSFADVQWLSDSCQMSCLVLFSVSCFYVYLFFFNGLILDISRVTQSFSSETISPPQSGERFFLKSTNLTDSHCCVFAKSLKWFLIPSSHSLSFGKSPHTLSIYINSLVFSSQSPYQLKYGIYINRAIYLLRQKVKILDSQN